MICTADKVNTWSHMAVFWSVLDFSSQV